ncbi:MAG: hypothetical protein QOJ26_1913 [Thermoplasmata archaeon]|nr:hypothetical protein [Thermoplasmata archaeon]
MVDWGLDTIAALSTALAVVTALAFGIVQVRHQNQRRREELALDALHAVLAPDVLSAVQIVLDLPDGVGQKELVKQPADVRAAIATVDFNLEAIGWMVHRRMVDLHDLDDLMGGVVRALWAKLAGLASERRASLGRPNDLEWLQWLAERMAEDPSPGKAQGAHVTHADWRR